MAGPTVRYIVYGQAMYNGNKLAVCQGMRLPSTYTTEEDAVGALVMGRLQSDCTGMWAVVVRQDLNGQGLWNWGTVVFRTDPEARAWFE